MGQTNTVNTSRPQVGGKGINMAKENRKLIAVTKQAYNILKAIRNKREAEGKVATILSVASEIIVKAAYGQKDNNVLG